MHALQTLGFHSAKCLLHTAVAEQGISRNMLFERQQTEEQDHPALKDD